MIKTENFIRAELDLMGVDLDAKLIYLTEVFILTENLREELCNPEGNGERGESILRSLRKQVSDDGSWIQQPHEMVGESDIGDPEEEW